MTALLTIEPLIVPVLLLAGVPTSLLSAVRASAEFAFVTRATPMYRARHYLRTVLTGRDEAKEIRAFELGSHLLERWQHSFRS